MSKLLGEGEPGFLESELQQLEDRFIAQLKMFDDLSNAERISLAVQEDFFERLQKLGLSHILQQLQFEYADIIKEIATYKPEGIAPIQYEELQTLTDLDTRSLLGQAQSYSSQFQSSLIKGFVAGETTEQVASRLDSIGLTSNQTIAAITTARDQFQASVMAHVFSDSPEVKFVLAGPVDAKTRCQCKAIMTHQPKDGLTKEEIDGGAWTRLAKEHCPKFTGDYTYVGRGGYNCRHFIQISSKQ